MAQFLFFGRFKDVSGDLAMDLPRAILSREELVEWLSASLDGFSAEWQRPGARMAVNKALVIESTPLNITDEDEIAFMSALSGG